VQARPYRSLCMLRSLSPGGAVRKRRLSKLGPSARKLRRGRRPLLSTTTVPRSGSARRHPRSRGRYRYAGLREAASHDRLLMAGTNRSQRTPTAAVRQSGDRLEGLLSGLASNLRYRPRADACWTRKPWRGATRTAGQLFRWALIVRTLAYMEGERTPLAVPLDIDQRVPRRTRGRVLAVNGRNYNIDGAKGNRRVAFNQNSSFGD